MRLSLSAKLKGRPLKRYAASAPAAALTCRNPAAETISASVSSAAIVNEPARPAPLFENIWKVTTPGPVPEASLVTATPGVPVETFEADAASFSGPSDVPIRLLSGTSLVGPSESVLVAGPCRPRQPDLEGGHRRRFEMARRARPVVSGVIELPLSNFKVPVAGWGLGVCRPGEGEQDEKTSSSTEGFH